MPDERPGETDALPGKTCGRDPAIAAFQDADAALTLVRPVIREFTENLRACATRIRAHEAALELPEITLPARTFTFEERPEALGNLPSLESIEALSIDVFDTCLVRSLANASDIFRLLGGFVERRTGMPAEDFVARRKDVETRLRRDGLADGSREDTTLEAVYTSLANDAGWSTAFRDEVAGREVMLERCFLHPDVSVRNYIREARAAGIRLVYTSEMYLSGQTLSRILEHAGFPVADEPVFTSGEHGLSKGTGNLYRQVIQDMGIGNLTHVGDNPVSDGQVPASIGLKSAVIQTRKRVYPDILSNVLHTVALERDKPDGADYWESLGFRVAGPVHLAFATYLYRECRRRGFSCLHFLSRDGWFPIQVFNKLQDHWGPVVTTHYTYASRELLGIGSMREIGAEEWEFLLKPSPLLRTRDIFDRLGVPEADFIPVLESSGLPGPDERICHHWGFRDPLTRDRLYAAVCEILPAFLTHRDRLSGHLRQYLDGLDLFDGTSAFMDLGWGGSSASCLKKLAPRLELAPAGFYFALLGPGGNDLSAYFTTGGERMELLKGSIALMEFLFGSPEPTVRDIDLTTGQARPVFRGKWRDRELAAWEGMERGLLRFADRCLELLDQPPPGDGSALVEETLRNWLYHPGATDLDMLGSLSHAEGWGTDHRLRMLPRPGLINREDMLREALCYCPWKPGLLKSM